ncbi:MAG: hypothetical protein IPK12_23800 [Gemmatimonadetes bacterium]|nr:hypothetical protein [Gemmatimonadota bacterium]
MSLFNVGALRSSIGAPRVDGPGRRYGSGHGSAPRVSLDQFATSLGAIFQAVEDGDIDSAQGALAALHEAAGVSLAYRPSALGPGARQGLGFAAMEELFAAVEAGDADAAQAALARMRQGRAPGGA